VSLGSPSCLEKIETDLFLSFLPWLGWTRALPRSEAFLSTRMVSSSGGLFFLGVGCSIPMQGARFSEGGYHGQLWRQRCVDVVAPTNVLIRADALQRAAACLGVQDAHALMTILGLEAQESGNFVAVTPDFRVPAAPSSLAPLPPRPYAMPGMMA
jgi:hypothetical protein